MNLFRTALQRTALVTAALLSLIGSAHAQHAGYRTFTIAGDTPTTVALFYPTTVDDRAIPIGPGCRPWRRALQSPKPG